MATKKKPAKKTPAKKTPAKKTPAKKTPAKKTPAKKKPAALFDALLTAWESSRHPALGDLLERLSQQVEGEAMAPLRDAWKQQSNVPQAVWLDAEAGSTPRDRDILARTLFNGTIKESKERMKRIAKWPPDPRVASIFAHDVTVVPKTSYATKALYNGMMRVLAKCGDVRAAAVIAAIDPMKYISMPDFFREKVPPLAETMGAFTHADVDAAELARWKKEVLAIVGDDGPEAPAAFEPSTKAPSRKPKLEHTTSHSNYDGLVQWAEHAGDRTLFTYAAASQERRATSDVTVAFVVVHDDGHMLHAGSNQGIVRMSEDGRWLAGIDAGPNEHALRLWNGDGELVSSWTVAQTKRCNAAIAFRGNVLYAAIGTADETRLVRADGGELVTLASTKDEVGTAKLTLAHTPSWIVLAHARGVWVLDAASGKLRHALDLGWVHTIAIAPDEKLLVKTYSGGALTPPDESRQTMYVGLVDLATAAGEWEIETPAGGMSFYDYDPQLAFAKGRALYVSGPDISEGKTVVREVDASGFSDLVSTSLATDGVRGAFVVQGERALAGGEEGWAHFHSLPELELLEERRGFVDSVDQVGISADGSVVTAWRRRKADIWGVEHKRLTSSSDYGYGAMVVSGDGRVGLASGLTMQLYSNTGKKIGTLKARMSVHAAQHVPAADLFCLAGSGGVVLFEPDGTLNVKMGDGVSIHDVAVRPDGELVVGASKTLLHLWSRSGESLGEVSRHDVRRVGFAADGTILALIDGDLFRMNERFEVLEPVDVGVSTFTTSRTGWLAIGYGDGRVRVRGAGEAAEIHASGPVRALALGDAHMVVGHAVRGTSGTVNVYAL